MRISIACFLFALAACALAPSLRADCVALPSGAVAWWRAETNANDSVGNHHGALVNGTSFIAGEVGAAFSFDGADDFVSVGDSADWDFGTNDFTIEFWVRLNALKNSMFIHQLNGSDRGGFEFDFQRQPDPLPPILGFAIDPNSFGISQIWSPTTNTWYHLAVTRTNSTFQLYVDGLQLGADQFDSRSVTNVSGPLHFGNYTQPGYELNGAMDEVTIYRRALSASEIAAIHTAGSAGKCFTPSLTISSTPTNAVVVSWQSPSTGFDLQQNTNGLTNLTWSNVSGIGDNGTNRFIIVNPPAGNRFYRLFKP